MKEYQEITIQDKVELELDKKAKALSNFISESDMFRTLPEDEQEQMKERCEIMWEYSEILEKLIATFTSSK